MVINHLLNGMILQALLSPKGFLRDKQMDFINPLFFLDDWTSRWLNNPLEGTLFPEGVVGIEGVGPVHSRKCYLFISWALTFLASSMVRK